jgi:hypothetical protein
MPVDSSFRKAQRNGNANAAPKKPVSQVRGLTFTPPPMAAGAGAGEPGKSVPNQHRSCITQHARVGLPQIDQHEAVERIA